MAKKAGLIDLALELAEKAIDKIIDKMNAKIRKLEQNQ